jgi:hypothetical protein
VPRIKLTKTAIDELPIPPCDVVYWDAALPGFGVKVRPKGRKVFIVLYRTGGAEAPEVYDRPIRAFHSPSGQSGSSESICGEAR